jgi:hypothetical protein
MNSAGSLSEEALTHTVLHLVGQSRAFLHQAEAALEEIAGMRDERARRLVEALRRTVATPAGPGTLRDVEQAGTELLRRLRDSDQP